jgi:hypothetical protein
MNDVRVQWLTQDESLWEADWLLYLLGDVTDHINAEFDPAAIKTDKNTVLICSHSVPYRRVLDKLRANEKQYVIVLLSDENLRDLCEWVHDPSCRGLLRNYLNPYMFRHPKVKVFGLGYKRDFKKSLDSTRERTLTWSFAGTLHNQRRNTVEKFKIFDQHELHECSGFGALDGLTTAEYAELLQKSKYALIPEGQDSMDSFRLYEALEAGCVPLTVTNSSRFKVIPSYWNGILDTPETLPFVIAPTWGEVVDKLRDETEQSYAEKQVDCEKLWNRTKKRWRSEFTRVCQTLV